MHKILFLLCIIMGCVVFVQGFAQRTVRVGVMLPLQDAQGNVSPRAVDFYRGMMLAVDSLRKDGTNYRIFTYNTANTPINSILNDTIIKHLDYIFGPETDIALKAVSNYTQPYHTKIINVFVPDCELLKTNANFYTLYAPQDVLAEQTAILLNKHTAHSRPNIVILDTGQPTHPLVSAVKKQVGKVRFLQMPYTEAQFKSRLHKERINWLVVSSADETSAQQVLAQVVEWKKQNPAYDVRVLGYPNWADFSASWQKSMYAADTYIYNSYFNDQYSQQNTAFAQQYYKLFNKEMDKTRPMMALMGFDYAYAILKTPNSNNNITPLQNGVRLIKYTKNGGWVNGNALLIHYRQDGKMELIKNGNK